LLLRAQFGPQEARDRRFDFFDIDVADALSLLFHNLVGKQTEEVLEPQLRFLIFASLV